jgi:hypothetical protein
VASFCIICLLRCVLSIAYLGVWVGMTGLRTVLISCEQLHITDRIAEGLSRLGMGDGALFWLFMRATIPMLSGTDAYLHSYVEVKISITISSLLNALFTLLAVTCL